MPKILYSQILQLTKSHRSKSWNVSKKDPTRVNEGKHQHSDQELAARDHTPNQPRTM